MSFKSISRTKKQDNNESGMLFASLIIVIVAFYIILSLKNQDVIIFLTKLESDAVKKLLLLVPVVYIFSLFILFFLIYFVGKYELEKKSHNLGIYLMLGMKKSKLFFKLISEEILNSVISLSIGLPIAIFLSEVISLITGKVVGMEIIQHKFSISFEAIIFTIVGYLAIRIFALLILSGSFLRKEINDLLSDSQEEKQKRCKIITMILEFTLAIVLLIRAYIMAIGGTAWLNPKNMALTLILGLLGTFILFKSIGLLLQGVISKGKKKSLTIFTFRQLQEFIFLKPYSLAISSILLLMALCCFGYEISVEMETNKENNAIHYTFTGDENLVETNLKKANVEKYIDQLFLMKINMLYSEKGQIVFYNNLVDVVKKQGGSGNESLINDLQRLESPYLISASSFNKLLDLSKKEELNLGDNQIDLYNNIKLNDPNTTPILEKALKEKPYLEINNKRYEMIDKIYSENLVTDRSITISYGLIVSDKIYNMLTTETNTNTYWNATINGSFVKEEGLMNAIMKINESLDSTDMVYESYLQNMGRQLFYSVAASYITIYLAIIFFIIANMVIGIQFLRQQGKTKKRYQILINLGVDYKMLCESTRKQINWYFMIPIVVAVISSFFGIESLFTGAMIPALDNKKNFLIVISIVVIVLLLMVEFGYIIMVKRTSDRRIKTFMEIKRGDN